MFKRQKNKLLDSTLAIKSVLTQWTKQLRPLTGVTQADFQALYVNTIENFIDFVTKPDEPVNMSFITESLEKVTLALKKHQGYLLPLGADSEVMFREREEWTFAVFTASLMNQVDVNVRFVLAKALLPKQAYAWLHRNQSLFLSWQEYLCGKRQNNCFSELIPPDSNTVENKLSKAVNSSVAEKEAPRLAKQVAQSMENTTTNNTDNDKYTLPDDAVIKSFNLHELQKKNKPSTVKPALDNEGIRLPEFTAPDFWQWLKRAITQDQIRVNQSDSVVHGVESGVLVLIPKAVEKFLAYWANRLNIPINDAIFSQVPALIKHIKREDGLIRHPQGSRIHSYCIGDWKARQVISGIVLNRKGFTDEKTRVNNNHQLTPDPLVMV